MFHGHWSEIARQWGQVGPPLRPSAEDLGFVADVTQRWARTHEGAPRVMILGVTPELYHAPWPAGARLLAVDCSPNMIDAVWPGPRTGVVCADWMALPLKKESSDIVLCDGGLHLLPYPNGHMKLLDALRHVLAPGGICILRLFVPPARRETPDSVLQNLLARKIPNLNLLKMRLWMALHEDVERGVELHRVWSTLGEVEPDLVRLAARLGWPADHLHSLNTYRNCHARYHFLDVGQVRHLFCAGQHRFVFQSVHFPTYDMGDQCPTVAFQRAGM